MSRLVSWVPWTGWLLCFHFNNKLLPLTRKGLLPSLSSDYLFSTVIVLIIAKAVPAHVAIEVTENAFGTSGPRRTALACYRTESISLTDLLSMSATECASAGAIVRTKSCRKESSFLCSSFAQRQKVCGLLYFTSLTRENFWKGPVLGKVDLLLFLKFGRRLLHTVNRFLVKFSTPLDLFRKMAAIN